MMLEQTENEGFEIATSEPFISLESAQCLKITEKVSFNIASEASCIYKNAKNGLIWRLF